MPYKKKSLHDQKLIVQNGELNRVDGDLVMSHGGYFWNMQNVMQVNILFSQARTEDGKGERGLEEGFSK